jgi:hypothetical protein
MILISSIILGNGPTSWNFCVSMSVWFPNVVLHVFQNIVVISLPSRFISSTFERSQSYHRPFFYIFWCVIIACLYLRFNLLTFVCIPRCVHCIQSQHASSIHFPISMSSMSSFSHAKPPCSANEGFRAVLTGHQLRQIPRDLSRTLETVTLVLI